MPRDNLIAKHGSLSDKEFKQYSNQLVKKRNLAHRIDEKLSEQLN